MNKNDNNLYRSAMNNNLNGLVVKGVPYKLENFDELHKLYMKWDKELISANDRNDKDEFNNIHQEYCQKYKSFFKTDFKHF